MRLVWNVVTDKFFESENFKIEIIVDYAEGGIGYLVYFDAAFNIEAFYTV